MQKMLNSKKYVIMFLIIAIIFVMLNSLGTVLYGNSNNTDSCIFNTVGKYWSKGQIPYINFFDHKGPLIFFINMLSWKFFNCERGILFFQVVSIFGILLGFKKITVLEKVGEKKSYLIIITTLLFLIPIYFAGNMTEEYCLPFLTMTLYFMLKYLNSYTKNKNTDHDYRYAFIYGISFAVCFLTRLTNAVSICVGILVILIILIKEKKIKNIFFNMLSFVAGFAILVFPFALYFAYNNAFWEFLDGTLLFNFKYAGNNASWLLKDGFIKNILKYMLFFMPSYIIFFAGIVRSRKNQKEVGLFYILLGVFETILFLSGRFFKHYAMISLPNLLLTLIDLENFRMSKLLKKMFYAIIIVVCIGIYIPMAKQLISTPFNSEQYDIIISNLSDEDKEKFIGWNVDVRMYEYYDICPYYKYFVTQDWHASMSEKTKNDIYDVFKNGDAKWIMVSGDSEDILIRECLDLRYKIVKIDYDSNLTLYKLKE